MSPPSESELTPLTKRDFKTVTTTKNKIVRTINNSLSDEAIIEYLLQEFPKALEEYSSIVFELSGLEPKIQSNKDFKFLKNLDFEALLNSDRLIDTKIKETKVLSLLEEVDRSNKLLTKTIQELKPGDAPVSKPDPTISATLVRVEKVSLVLKLSLVRVLLRCLNNLTDVLPKVALKRSKQWPRNPRTS